MAATKKKMTKKQEALLRQLRKERLINEIVGFVLLFFGVYGIYSILAEEAGLIGEGIKKAFYFLFGTRGTTVLMVVLVLCAAYIIIRFRPLRMNKRVFLLFALLVIFCCMLHISTVADIASPVLRNMLQIASGIDGNIGGLIGMGLAKGFVTLFSKTGSYIFLSFLSLAIILIMARKVIGEWISRRKEMQKEKAPPKKRNGRKRTEETGQIEEKKSFSEVQAWMRQLEAENGESEEEAVLPPPIEKEPVKAAKSKPVKEEIVEIKEIAVKRADADNKYVYPPISLLNNHKSTTKENKAETLKNAEKLETTLKSFGINAKIIGISVGPTITRYELELEAGVRVNKIVNLAEDIALALAAPRVRIEAPIPGKSAVGIEVPNKDAAIVHIREVISTKEFKEHPSPVAVALGKNLAGQLLMCDLRKMPHMLVAGATGAGKSVCINAILTSILYRSSPQEVRLILIDPKRVELGAYNGLPHLLVPVVIDPKQAAGALNWAVAEMMDRYQKFSDSKVRDIGGYNAKMEKEGGQALPLIVIIIDEFADLMMVAPQQVEAAVCRLAQLARAAGIHLIVATQRPSTDVITGLIKANIPSRISFMVSSQVDSRVILDMAGAEKLLGKGDMLYYPAGLSQPMRGQCAFIDEKEVERLTDFIKKNSQQDYNEEVIEKIASPRGGNSDFEDELFEEAVRLAIELEKISTSMIQRKLRIGYARAGRMIDEMEERGYVSPPDGARPRNVLVTLEEFENRNNPVLQEEIAEESSDA